MSDSIKNIEQGRKYWFIRTNHGEYYDEFLADNFIAIAWNEFSNKQLFESIPKKEVVERIRSKYPNDKIRPGYIYGQIKMFFFDIAVGDVVVIPSAKSKRISFGEIISDVYNEPGLKRDDDILVQKQCPFTKRRKVKWIQHISNREIDPYMYKILLSQGTVSNATRYSSFIDKTMYSRFVKGEKAHLIINVEKRKSISTTELLSLINSINELIESSYNEVGLHGGDVEIKLSLQSPGKVEFIFNWLASIPVFSVFKDMRDLDDQQLERLSQIEAENDDRRKIISEIRQSMKELHVSMDEIAATKTEGE